MVNIRSGFTFYLLKKEKNPVSSLPRALFTLLQSRHLALVSFNHQGQNRITIQPNTVFFHHFETITFMNS